MTPTHPPTGPEPRRFDRLREQWERFEASRAGALQRRIVEVQLTKQALIMAALGLMLVVPALITLAAVVPLGRSEGPVGAVTRRIGLTPQATHDLQQLFPTDAAVTSATTWIGVALTVVLTVRWPLALQQALERIWDLPRGGLRTAWRALVWLAGFLGVMALAVVFVPVLDGVARVVALLVIGLPVAIVWAWWTHHLLLGGRVPWRALLPGAVLTGIGLVGLRLGAAVLLSPVITSNYRQYGPLGIVFVLLSAFVSFGVVLLGGAVVGHLLTVGLPRSGAPRHPRGMRSPDRPAAKVGAGPRPGRPAPQGAPDTEEDPWRP